MIVLALWKVWKENMSAIQPLCHLIGIKPEQLLKHEYFLLEAELFLRAHKELKEFFRDEHKEYFRILKFTIEMENNMLDKSFARLITKDILASKEYDLDGIAYYADTPQDVILEVIDGRNERPTATFLCRIIELHRSVRRDLYDKIMKKIAHQYLTVV
jgi:hypothetical protein